MTRVTGEWALVPFAGIDGSTIDICPWHVSTVKHAASIYQNESSTVFRLQMSGGQELYVVGASREEVLARLGAGAVALKRPGGKDE